MHLSNNDNSERFGGVSEKILEKKLPSNGISEIHQDDRFTKTPTQQDGQTSRSNEVHILFPQGRFSDEVLDTVLTAWTLLIHRYQRDIFHQFTWGIKDAGDSSSQCISTSGFDLLNQKAPGSVRQKIRDVRSRSITVEPNITIFLNDGTKVEVRTSEESSHESY
jgi:hypothetical protein